MISEYVYLGDKMTDTGLIGMRCCAVRRGGKCVRGKSGGMLVSCQDGVNRVVLARHLRRLDKYDDNQIKHMVEKQKR